MFPPARQQLPLGLYTSLSAMRDERRLVARPRLVSCVSLLTSNHLPLHHRKFHPLSFSPRPLLSALSRISGVLEGSDFLTGKFVRSILCSQKGAFSDACMGHSLQVPSRSPPENHAAAESSNTLQQHRTLTDSVCRARKGREELS